MVILKLLLKKLVLYLDLINTYNTEQSEVLETLMWILVKGRV